MAKLNKNAKAWSVAAGKILEKIKPGMPDAMVEQIREQANDQALKDVYGADYMLNLDVHGNPQEAGIGSTREALRGDREIPRPRSGQSREGADCAAPDRLCAPQR
jgi:hypothetical protein